MEHDLGNGALRAGHIDGLVANRNYRAGLYLRFSKDDGKTADNSSIVTQEMLARKFCEENGFTVHDVYKDDGYSGLSFDRPGFQRLLADIESGAVNLVITKDLSRLGRDYIQTGYYTEIFFTERNVRYIAINDNVDTINADNDIAPFRNILNDMYSKDISRKVKSAKRQRAFKGYFINPNAPYGYVKHPEDRNRLIVDNEVADTVREIFALALSGCGAQVIANTLTERRVLIPSAYKTSKGIKGFGHFNGRGKEGYDHRWKYNTVLQILRDRVYAGDMVNHKYETPHYKAKKLKAVPKDGHIVVPDTHEAIVSRDDFLRVQELITSRHTPRKHEHDNVFRGLLFCAECGKRMSLSNQHIKGKGGKITHKSLYRCMNRYTNPDECGHYNYVYYDVLHDEVRARLKVFTERVKSGEVLNIVLKQTADKRSAGDKLRAEKVNAEKRLNALAVVMRRLYEDYATEELDGDNYKAMLAEYQAEQRALKERLAVIGVELSKGDDLEERVRKLNGLAAEYAECRELTAEMLARLVERIEIRPPEKSDGVTVQDITIVYRFIRTDLE